MHRIASVSFFSFAALGTLVACGGGAGELVRPKDYNAQTALGATAAKCTGEPKLAKPLVIDLEADNRVALEGAMQGGVTIVAFDCAELRVLNNCHLAEKGQYDYVATSLNEQVVQLKGQDDLKANLPFSSGKLGGEVQSGRTIDLGLVYVGMKSTVVGAVKREDLVGTCDGATHFVQNASVGAFAMSTGSGGKVGAVGELFSVGASASSESSRSNKTTQGSLEACRDADPDSDKPPSKCRAPLRVELSPIVGKAQLAAVANADPKAAKETPEEKAAKSKPIENPCPEGFVMAEGKCAKPTEAVAFVCDASKPAECKTQCEKGNVGSCYNYGAYAKDHEEAKIDASPYFEKACAGKIADGCAYQGFMIMRKKDTSKRTQEVALYKQGCDMGSAQGCSFLSSALGSTDPAGSVKALHRGCGLGDGMSCNFEADAYLAGTGVPKDTKKGLAIYDKACNAGIGEVCAAYAEVLRKGETAPKNLAAAQKIAAKQCTDEPNEVMRAFRCDAQAQIELDMGKNDQAIVTAKKACREDGNGCKSLAAMYETGKGVKKDKAAAIALYKKMCKEELDVMIDSLSDHPVCTKPGVK